MRQLGILPQESDARRFTAYLITQGISAQAEQDDGEWAVWVRDENDVQRARDALQHFLAAPNDPRYQGVTKEADQILRQEQKKRAHARKNMIQMRDRWNAPATRRMPLVVTAIVLSVVLWFATGFGFAREGIDAVILDQLQFVGRRNYLESLDPLVSIRQGELWRLVTPIFLHHGVIHLLFNMWMLFYLGGQVEERRGTWRLALLGLALAVISNLLQGVVPVDYGGSPIFGGMSGVNYGLFGYIWIKSTVEPSLGLYVSPSTTVILLVWFVLCFTPLIPDIANLAHGAGLVTGLVLGYIPSIGRSS